MTVLKISLKECWKLNNKSEIARVYSSSTQFICVIYRNKSKGGTFVLNKNTKLFEKANMSIIGLMLREDVTCNSIRELASILNENHIVYDKGPIRIGPARMKLDRTRKYKITKK